MIEVNPNNGNEIWGIFKSEIIYFFYEKMLKNLNDFQNHILLIHDCSEPKQWK